MNSLKTVFVSILIIISTFVTEAASQSHTARDYGIEIGIMDPGVMNAITDVSGVEVGHSTLRKGDSVRTGVTAILAHGGNLFRQKVPAGVYVSNGFGKMAGTTQIKELGTLETPIVLTNTLSVPTAANALITHTLKQSGNRSVTSVNPVVGETNDGWLNDIRGRHVEQKHVLQAIEQADSGRVRQGALGAGTGTSAFGFKGGIGTGSRKIPEQLGNFTVGVLVQSNFGGILKIDGVPVGEELGQYYYDSIYENQSEGSCMIVVATDAPLTSRNLERLAKRATLGLARTGGFASNGSGDYAIAFSTHPDLRVSDRADSDTRKQTVLRNAAMNPLFLAAVEATEEAIVNSLFTASDTEGQNGHSISALPLREVLQIFNQYGRTVKTPE